MSDSLRPASNFSLGTTPTAPPQEQGFGQQVLDAWWLQDSIQAVEYGAELLYPSQEGYDPLKDERLKGKEMWAPWLRETRSPEEFGAKLARYERNVEAQARQAEDGSIWAELAAGMLDPVNLIPIPGAALGKGLVKGAAAGAAIAGLTAVPMRAIGEAVNPLRGQDPLLEELFYSTAFGGILGGLAGGLSKLGDIGDFHPGVGRISRAMAEREADLDGLLNPQVGDDGIPRAPVRPIQYVARASDGNEGWAPAFGLEHLTAKGGILNPLATSVGWAVQSGVRAFQDLALQLGGDFGLKTKDADLGIATPHSAWLGAGRWRAVAADTLAELHQAYSEYLGKPNPLQVAGLNVSAQGARAGGAVRKLFKRQRADGKLEFNDWLEAVTLAHRADRIEPNLTKFVDKSDEAAASVTKGAGIVRKFFDKADAEGTNKGFIKEPYPKYLARRFDIHDRNEAEIERLAALEARTANQEAELRYRTDTMRPRLMGKIPQKAHLERQYANLRAAWDAGIKAGRSRADLAPLHQAMRALENQGIGLRKVGSTPVKGTVTNPVTNQTPPAAANADPVAANDAAIAANDAAAAELNVAFQAVGKDGIEGGKAANDARPLEFSIAEAKPAPTLSPEVRARIDEMSAEELEDVLDGADEIPEVEALYLERRLSQLVRERWERENPDMADGIGDDFYGTDENFEDGTQQFEINREGRPVAEIRARYNEETKTILVDWIGVLGDRSDAPNSLGPKFTLDVGTELRRLFPDAEKVAGFRISGARRRAGATGAAEMRLPTRKAATIQTIEPGDATTTGVMPAPANDDTPRTQGVSDDIQPASRLDDGTLEGYELVPANDNTDLGGPETDPNYLPRRWDTEAVRADPDRLRAIFDRWADTTGQKRFTDEEWEKTLSRILQGEGGRPRDDFRGDAVGGHFRHGRKLDIPNEEVTDFIERNAASLVLDYANRFGPGLEVHERFGERDAMDAIDAAVVEAMRERTGSVDDLLAFGEEATGHFQYIRDQTLGDLHKDDPLNQTKVGVETAKAYTATVLLGKVVFSQLVELARPLMTHGFMRNFQFISDNLIGNLSEFQKAGKGLRSIVGEGIDTALGMSVQRMLEVGDLNRPGSTLAHRTKAAVRPFMNFAHGPWYIMNLMGPVTDITKNYVMVMSSHFLIHDMQRLVTGQAGQRTVANLAALGIDREAAGQMLSQGVERAGRLNVANLQGWADQALANRFAAAIRGDVNRVINTPSPQTKSPISQGFLTRGDGRRQHALVTLPFQFMSWGLSAAQKISMSALQGRDANAMGGIAALIGTAYMAQWMKSDASSWEKTDFEERVFRAVDSSGALAFVGSLNSMVETGTAGTVGLRPAFGMPPGYGQPDAADASGAWAGPVGSRVADAYKAFFDPEMEAWQRASVLRRAIPTSGLFYTDRLWKGVQSGMMDPE